MKTIRTAWNKTFMYWIGLRFFLIGRIISMKQIMDEISNLGTEAGDILFDTFFDNEIVQKLPVIGWSASLLKIGKSVSDIIFLNKLKIFINDINSEKIDDKWREKFSDKDECLKITRKVLFLIDSITEEKKLKYLARIFCDYVNGKISKDAFNLYTEIIKNLFISLLEKIVYFEEKKVYTGFSVNKEYQAAFYHLQANSFFELTSGAINDGIPYMLNSIGLYFRDIVKDINNL